MKTIFRFLQTSLVGGFFVLLPLVLFIFLLDEVFGLVVVLATPIADLFPKGMFEPIETPVLLAVLLIVIVSFFLGLAARITVLSRLGIWIEQRMLKKLPMYTAIKRLSLGLIGSEKAHAFKPAVMTSSKNEREIVYLIEDHQDGEATVLVPWAPAAFAGSVKIVEFSCLEILDTNLDSASRTLSHWGVGVRELLGKGNKTKGK